MYHTPDMHPYKVALLQFYRDFGYTRESLINKLVSAPSEQGFATEKTATVAKAILNNMLEQIEEVLLIQGVQFDVNHLSLLQRIARRCDVNLMINLDTLQIKFKALPPPED